MLRGRQKAVANRPREECEGLRVHQWGGSDWATSLAWSLLAIAMFVHQRITELPTDSEASHSPIFDASRRNM